MSPLDSVRLPINVL